MRYLVLLALAAMIGFGGAALAADKSLTASNGAYPPEAVKELQTGCLSAKGMPADKVQAICSCYSTMVQTDIPYSTFAKVSAAMKDKGPGGLDADGKAAIEKNGLDASYCRQKNHAASAASEAATFPETEIPALRASCENFQDVPADRKPAVCTCYVGLVRTKMEFNEWQLLRLAIATKGVDRLDSEEAGILNKVRTARLECDRPPAK